MQNRGHVDVKRMHARERERESKANLANRGSYPLLSILNTSLSVLI
jgi:hypothetical protein